eukprot:Lankesteria_metandrocarpae@DN5484_c1_g2_i2.p1
MIMMNVAVVLLVPGLALAAASKAEEFRALLRDDARAQSVLLATEVDTSDQINTVIDVYQMNESGRAAALDGYLESKIDSVVTKLWSNSDTIQQGTDPISIAKRQHTQLLSDASTLRGESKTRRDSLSAQPFNAYGRRPQQLLLKTPASYNNFSSAELSYYIMTIVTVNKSGQKEQILLSRVFTPHINSNGCLSGSISKARTTSFRKYKSLSSLESRQGVFAFSHEYGGMRKLVIEYSIESADKKVQVFVFSWRWTDFNIEDYFKTQSEYGSSFAPVVILSSEVRH